MRKLENLQLGYNLIQEIPSSYSKFINLKSICLQNNKMTVFPFCLCELKHLDVIDLSENKIQELPENMEKLQCIELNMNMNQLKVLPPSLSLCPRLKVLRVAENLLELESITTEFLKNSQVCVLAVDGNLFQMKHLTDKDGYEQVGWAQISSLKELSTLNLTCYSATCQLTPNTFLLCVYLSH